MLEVLYDIEKKFDIQCANKEYISIFISSNNNYAKEVVYRVCDELFQNNITYFMAEGYPDNLNDIIEDLKINAIAYNKGVIKKFSVKQLPCILYKEIINNIEEVLECWSSTIYEKRCIYICTKEDIGFEEGLIEAVNNSDEKYNCYSETDCMIESAQDAEYKNSFIITVKRIYLDSIINIISEETKKFAIISKK